MYLVIRASMVFGIFSNKTYMREAIEQYIKDKYESHGYHGDYHFRYIKFEANEPWFTKDGKYHHDIAKALFSLSTIHDEYFTHKIKTDWSTGEILDIDADTTNNLNYK